MRPCWSWGRGRWVGGGGHGGRAEARAPAAGSAGSAVGSLEAPAEVGGGGGLLVTHLVEESFQQLQQRLIPLPQPPELAAQPGPEGVDEAATPLRLQPDALGGL